MDIIIFVHYFKWELFSTYSAVFGGGLIEDWPLKHLILFVYQHEPQLDVYDLLNFPVRGLLPKNHELLKMKIEVTIKAEALKLAHSAWVFQ